jgi:hypothetical protein
MTTKRATKALAPNRNTQQRNASLKHSATATNLLKAAHKRHRSGSIHTGDRAPVKTY